MSRTLEEAIEHAEDIAVSAIGCECREEHRQLAEWLRELVERRKAPEIITCGECRHRDPEEMRKGEPNDYYESIRKTNKRLGEDKEGVFNGQPKRLCGSFWF